MTLLNNNKRLEGEVVYMNIEIENKIISWTRTYKNFLFFVIISCFGLVVRHFEFPFLSGDMREFLLPWFDDMKNTGGGSVT